MRIHHYKEQPADVYLASFYVAAFATWGKDFENGLVSEIREWCTKSFGPESKLPDARWTDDIIWGEIRFRDEKDLLAFLLRWE